jgi:hypothetical protein
MKPSAVWIIAGVLILFYLINHWMSCELSQPKPPKQTVEAPFIDVSEKQTPTLTIPGVPIDERIVKPEIKTPQAPKAVEKAQGPSEPVYEPPSNDVIMVQ